MKRLYVGMNFGAFLAWHPNHKHIVFKSPMCPFSVSKLALNEI